MTEKPKDIYCNISEPLEILRRLIEWAKANPEAAILISKGLAEAALLASPGTGKQFPDRASVNVEAFLRP